jgi:hypothetical protein
VTTRGDAIAAPSGSNAIARRDAMDDAEAREVKRAYRLARDGIASMVERYFQTNAAAHAACVELLKVSGADLEAYASPDAVAREIPLDHLAFRSFAMDDFGVDGVCDTFEAAGYSTVSEEEGPGAVLEFPEKRVRARWMRPPRTPDGEVPLPRIFVSELVVDACEPELRDMLKEVLSRVREGKVLQSGEWADGRNARWQLPTASTYARVERLSEYASWTLLHGYAVNHAAVSLFQLRKKFPDTPARSLQDVESVFAGHHALSRKRWNDAGGRIKRSPSGLLLQSSLMSVKHTFKLYKKTEKIVDRYGAETMDPKFKEYNLPGSYIEFVERLPRPENAEKAFEDLEEVDLRDGFETGNASKIFESTSTRILSGADQVGAAPGAAPGAASTRGVEQQRKFKPSSMAPTVARAASEGRGAQAPASAAADVIDLT